MPSSLPFHDHGLLAIFCPLLYEEQAHPFPCPRCKWWRVPADFFLASSFYIELKQAMLSEYVWSQVALDGDFLWIQAWQTQ